MSFQDAAETALEQSVQELYLLLFDHSLGHVTCRYIADNIVALVLDASTTPIEQVLLQGNRLATAQSFREQMTLILERHLIAMVSKEYQCAVSNVIRQHQADAGCMSLFIVIDNV